MSNGQVNTVVQSDWLQERLLKVIKAEVEAVAIRELDAAAEHIKKEVPAICAKVGIELQSMVSFHRHGAELRISITQKE